jgi:hypothetical protein
VPLRLNFECLGCRPDAELRENVHRSSRYPRLTPRPLHDRPLAVVGGGSSIRSNLDDLRAWPGDIWGINQTASWLISQGRPDATLFTCDPQPALARMTTGVQRALLADSCDPSLFDALTAADVSVFELSSFIGGPATATRAPMLALLQGYRHITFFGCEGCLEETSTHAYRDEQALEMYAYQLLVRAGDRIYRTTPQFYATTVYLADLITALPGFLAERSGGLLRGMLEHPETWEVIAYSRALRDQIDPSAEPFRLSRDS